MLVTLRLVMVHPTHHELYIDTIHISEPTRAIISLQSQYIDDQSEGLSKPFTHEIDFVIFRAGEYEPIFFSQKNDAASHYGVAVEIDLLEAGDYVLHVCHAVSFTPLMQVSLSNILAED